MENYLSDNYMLLESESLLLRYVEEGIASMERYLRFMAVCENIDEDGYIE
jgi:hypothetical protein